MFTVSGTIVVDKDDCQTIEYPAFVTYFCHKCLITIFEGSLQTMCISANISILEFVTS